MVIVDISTFSIIEYLWYICVAQLHTWKLVKIPTLTGKDEQSSITYSYISLFCYQTFCVWLIVGGAGYQYYCDILCILYINIKMIISPSIIYIINSILNAIVTIIHLKKMDNCIIYVICSIIIIKFSYLTAGDLIAVMKATQTISDWYTLGLTLGILSHVLDKITMDESKVLNRQRSMLQHWLDTGHASWMMLVDALMNPLINKDGLAKEIARNHPCEYICY